MEYHEAANFLFDLRRYPPAEGVESTRRLLDHLDGPGEELQVVQVAGSNGKGSTARMVESVLRQAGYDVGIYTSPHLNDVRERIRLDGRTVSKQAVTEFVERVEPYVNDRTAEGDPPTFFEALTALAVWSFARANVDVAVLEVGIGGRYDATSALDTDAAAVTSVSLEHTDMLGDTVEEIARDLAAVAPADAPLVTAATGAALSAVESVADVYRVGTAADADLRVTDGGREGLEQAVGIETDDWSARTSLPLLGAYQVRNAGVAAALARQFDGVSPAAVERGLRNAHWAGRFEVMERNPLVVLDGAHNPASCEGVAETLSTFECDSLHIVFGAMCDKDIAEMAAALPDADRVYACRPDLERAETPAILASAFDDAVDAGTRGSVADAVDAALSAADAGDAVLICGSLRVVAEARRRWTRLHVPRRVDDLETAAAVMEAADVSAGDVQRARADGVHRVVTTRLSPRQADHVRRELLSIGGRCVVSGLSTRGREPVDIALMGTVAQFRRLLDALDGEPHGLEVVGDDLRETLDLEAASETDTDAAVYPWDSGTAVMGVLNVTPDSFHDGGRFEARDDAVARAEAMVEAGADIVDVGGESTRPGADPVPVDEEIDRVRPVVEALADLDVFVSIDTRKAAVARAALAAGADVLNDVSGLEDPEMRLVAAEHQVPVVVMHSIETPVDPDVDVEYDDVVDDTLAALSERVLLAEKAGLDRSQIIVDPGLGFGKSAVESFELLGRLDEFRALGCPVLVGHSRKSMFGLVGREASGDRLPATLAATSLAADRGADIVRVHDVAENVAAVRTAEMAADPGVDDR
ncbi:MULTISPECIES: dihydropteroate synthase [unclassified Halorubrum]|uniref:dihydropteroate synthase n=1 Tax=unclassified Halorubrum TaxID=2642239 RepID=UPI000B992637|nr:MULTISPECIES: dihydropteroate synthase [unclassified Halorubrum]OYR46488.1 dihydropteroate synthase [Halorubrum sp. Ea8]OYR47246.1 dihydropteroate synthase [Halorubrum sp. Eb13]OYR55085.1 dihydropteroate synthase [Halorubrum sp. Ea1]